MLLLLSSTTNVNGGLGVPELCSSDMLNSALGMVTPTVAGLLSIYMSACLGTCSLFGYGVECLAFEVLDFISL